MIIQNPTPIQRTDEHLGPLGGGHGDTSLGHCSAEPYIRIEKLSLHYGDTQVLEDVVLPVAHGQVTALVGPSGSGKSSLLTAVNRLTDLLPGCRIDGNITVGGADVMDMDPVALRRKVGFIFQKPNPFPMSIRKNLSLPLTEHGITDKREIERRSTKALKDVGLWDEVQHRLNSRATTLSGGQQQRLCIARALVLQPDALLMDEPCSALDPIASAKVEQLIVSLKGRYTVLMVTHNLAQAERVADHIGLLWAQNGPGRLIEHGPTAELFSNPSNPLTTQYLCSTGRC
jgi:phosphate transport system ATP-binding protein